MAFDPAAALVTLDRYLSTGGAYGPDVHANVDDALSEIMAAAILDREWRRRFASMSLFERTLNPPSIKKTTLVLPQTQVRMLEPLYDSLAGGLWFKPDPAGLTSWIGSEDGGRYYFVEAIASPPRVEDGLEYEMPFEVMAVLLKIIRDAAMPASWFAELAKAEVFKKLEARISRGDYSALRRRALLALNAQAAARVATELAKLATAQTGAFPSFPAGDGRATPTVPPRAKPWYRSGWTWVGAAGGLAAGGMLAARR